MSKQLTLATVLSSAIIFTACGGGGGGGGSDDTTPPEVTLTLTVGKVTIDSTSTVSRITTTLSGYNKAVTTIDINKDGEISINGTDSDLFALNGTGKSRTLTFVQQPVASDPIDENGDGVYEVDIKGEDTDGNSVTYKAAYKIAVPYTAKSKLSGKTYYVDQGDNKYIEVKYTDTGFTEKYYVDTEPSGTVLNQDITYDNDKFKFTNNEGEDITCTVGPNTPPSLKCSKAGSSTQETINYLASAPAFVVPSSYIVSASDDDIVNHEDFSVPKIKSFKVTGNKPAEDGQAIVSKSKLGGKFSYTIEIDNEMFLKKSFVRLGNSGVGISATPGSNLLEKYTDSCKLLSIDSGVKYMCTAEDGTQPINVDNQEASNDTYFIVYLCDKQDLDDTDIKCSAAKVPVLFED